MIKISQKPVETDVNNGKGLLGTLTTDTTLQGKLYHIIGSLNVAGEQSARASDELAGYVHDIGEGKGTLGILLRDTSLSNDLKTSVDNLRQSSENLKQSMEAVKKIPLLQKYIEEADKKPKPKK